ncbi:MAG: class I SAM-dependent methyltransferase [bacterium]
MKISKRLELLSKETVGCNTIVDVGCDHGLFSIYSVLNHGIKHAYLLDINEEPLNSAKLNCVKYKVTDKVTYLLSDGLIEFKGTLDCLVISGIGGYLMTKILSQSLDKIKQANKIVLQPNSDFEVLRKFLFDNGFDIVLENMILDNDKYCYYLTAELGQVEYTEEDITFGPLLRHNISTTYSNYWEKKYNALLKELTNVKDNSQKIKLENYIEKIKENIITKR